jgi:hypothetical protein
MPQDNGMAAGGKRTAVSDFTSNQPLGETTVCVAFGFLGDSVDIEAVFLPGGGEVHPSCFSPLQIFEWSHAIESEVEKEREDSQQYALELERM